MITKSHKLGSKKHLNLVKDLMDYVNGDFKRHCVELDSMKINYNIIITKIEKDIKLHIDCVDKIYNFTSSGFSSGVDLKQLR